jgi:heterodisulfide reductase subunit A
MKNILIIGGGIAGMEAAKQLALLNYKVTLVERKHELGGYVANWDRLFPNKRPSKEVISKLNEGAAHNNITTYTNTDVLSIEKNGNKFEAELSGGKKITADAVLLTTGYNLFDAYRKEEYGYGIYNNVITSAELERMFTKGEIKTAEGKTPERVGIVHCVGSRDEKCGNLYCSKVCCVTGVKQAIEIKEMLPNTEVFNFYMDLRMFGRGFERLYLEAQQKHRVRFIRGRLSEAAEKQDHSIFIKVDDTLVGRPMKMSVDLLVLMVGFEPAKANKNLYGQLGLQNNEDNFIAVKDVHLDGNRTNIPGIFVAGACTGAKSINETLADADSAALVINEELKINH